VTSDDGDYTVTERQNATDFMAGFEGYGEMRSYTGPLGAEQVAFTWRQMPPGTGGRGSYGHRHRSQEEIYFVISGTVTFKVGDHVFDVGPETAVRIAPRALRSIHNDTDEVAELVLCSIRVADLESEVDTEEGFWPQ
jgi:mannose-6-phosphate isomerase-like protein (cupin superfamily)